MKRFFNKRPGVYSMPYYGPYSHHGGGCLGSQAQAIQQFIKEMGRQWFLGDSEIWAFKRGPTADLGVIAIVRRCREANIPNNGHYLNAIKGFARRTQLQFTCCFLFRNETWITICVELRLIKRTMKRLARIVRELNQMGGPMATGA